MSSIMYQNITGSEVSYAPSFGEWMRIIAEIFHHSHFELTLHVVHVSHKNCGPARGHIAWHIPQ